MLFYITFIDFKNFNWPGKERKIKGQIKAMEAELGEIYYTNYSYPMIYLFKSEKVIERQAAVTRKDRVLVLCDWIRKYGVTKTYIRYPRASKWFIDLLKYQKEHHIKTVLEIATFPYDGEMIEGMAKTEDMCYRKEICKYVDRIATYSSDSIIWGIECIGLKNGISAADVIIHKKAKKDKQIVLIAVSTMIYWQGYERILEGMYWYYKEGGEYDIRFKMVGSGPEEQKYKDIVKKYKLDSKVEFIGRIEALEIDRLNSQYDSSDIAVGSLGRYKNKLDTISTIKGAEYCAKGIPFICGHQDSRFPPGWKYMMNVSNSPNPIDMNAVIDFYNKVISNKNYREEMRDYAMNHLTWNIIMRPIIDYFLKEEY